jgi:hypothetical protein
MAKIPLSSVEIDAQVAAFIHDALIPSTEHKTSSQDVYKFYKKYCRAIERDHQINTQSLGMRLVHYFYKTRSNGVTYYHLSLRQDLLIEGE